MDWSSHYPDYLDTEETTLGSTRPRQLRKDVDIVDIGCGFGGLTVALAPKLPDSLILGE
jgi:tRNA G46 methylase TrmB